MSESSSPLPIKVLENNFIQVPRIWTDKLMGSKFHFPNGRKAAQLPGSFWVYSLFLWRHITGGNYDRETTQAASEFPVRSDAATRWTAAYSVSGLFQVTFGKWTAQHDQPTKFRYNVNATEEEWAAFIQALDLTLNEMKLESKGTNRNTWSNTGGFKVKLALHVDAMRAEQKLPPVNAEFLRAAAAGEITDRDDRPIAEKDAGGNILPIFYKTSQRMQRVA